jgi:formate-dependent nitrite reductase cytochrome c552 subunit
MKYRRKYMVICTACGSECYKDLAKLKRNKNHFCSSKCYWKSITGKVGVNTGKRWKLSEESKRNIGLGHIGIRRTENQKRILREIHIGDRNPQWRGGITPKNMLIRSSAEYREWRKAVFARDNFTCQMCKVRGGKLNADHIKPFSLFIELRLDINNGRTLCEGCHKKTETYGKKLLLNTKNVCKVSKDT